MARVIPLEAAARLRPRTSPNPRKHLRAMAVTSKHESCYRPARRRNADCRLLRAGLGPVQGSVVRYSGFGARRSFSDRSGRRCNSRAGRGRTIGRADGHGYDFWLTASGFVGSRLAIRLSALVKHVPLAFRCSAIDSFAPAVPSGSRPSVFRRYLRRLRSREVLPLAP